MKTMDWKKEYLYHYTTFESAVKILVSKKLLFSDFTKLNDINESCGVELMYNGFSDADEKAFNNELSKYKQISFTTDGERKGFDIPAMWGHYACGGKGVCLVFDKYHLVADVKTSPLLYSNRVLYSAMENPYYKVFSKSYGVSIEQFVVSSKDELFFHKTEDWAYEQEYRIIAISDEIRSLEIGNYIVAAILFNRQHRDFLKSVEYASLSKINPNIGIYRYAPRINDFEGNLFEVEGNSIRPKIQMDFSITRNVKGEL